MCVTNSDEPSFLKGKPASVWMVDEDVRREPNSRRRQKKPGVVPDEDGFQGETDFSGEISWKL